MKRFPVLASIMLVGAVAAPMADEEGFSSQPPAVRDISPVIDGDPYYECANYGYQLSKGACAPGWPPPSEGWTGGAPGIAGGGASWRPEQVYPSPYPGGFFGAPGGPPRPPHDSPPWRAEAAYPWAPDYWEWGRSRMPDSVGSPWDQAAPGWGRAGQAVDAPSSAYPPADARRGAAADGQGQGRGDMADPFRAGTMPWDPWLQDPPGDSGSIMPAGSGTAAGTEPEAQPVGAAPGNNGPAGPASSSHGPAREVIPDDAPQGPAGGRDPLR